MAINIDYLVGNRFVAPQQSSIVLGSRGPCGVLFPVPQQVLRELKTFKLFLPEPKVQILKTTIQIHLNLPEKVHVTDYE